MRLCASLLAPLACLILLCPYGSVFSEENSDSEILLLRRQASDYFAGEQYRLAIDTFKKLRVLAPEDLESLYRLGSSYYQLGYYRHAIEHYKEVIAKSPAYVAAYLGLGSSYNALGQYEDAVRAYDKALGLDSRNVYAHHGRAAALFNARRYVQARLAYIKAKELYEAFGDIPAANDAERFIRDLDRRVALGQTSSLMSDVARRQQWDRFARMLPFRGFDLFVYALFLALTGLFVWLYAKNKHIALIEQGISVALIATGCVRALAGTAMLFFVSHFFPGFARLALALAGLFFIYLGIAFLQHSKRLCSLILWSQGGIVILYVGILGVLPQRVFTDALASSYFFGHLAVEIILFIFYYLGLTRSQNDEVAGFLLR